ncbi:putative ABC transporter-binding protein [Lachnospiraceae bacterium]|nr:putative ABC transporter-binding protein [Lachnospiraceae bacterium]
MKKRLIALLLAGTMAVSLAACGPDNSNPSDSVSNGSSEDVQQSTPSESTPEESTPETTPAPEAQGYSEAPMLADLVQGGTLPKLEDRLPAADDIFVDTADAAGNPLEIGTYGGVINLLGAGGSWGLSRPVLEGIIRYNSDGTYYANVIKSFEHNDDYTVWTFKLREGMKWSDGEDFNADDITFWYYMCHLTNYDTKKSWAALKETVDGEDAWANLEKVDDYTVTWTFANPKFPADFVENGDFKWCWAPEHYLNDMIPDSVYVENPYWEKTGLSDEQVLLNAQAKGIDAATVSDLGKAVTYYWWNEDGIPNLNSYVLTTKEGNNSRDAQLCILERNPYFWKVDAQGQQLPYCDEIHFNATSEDGQDQLMFRSGELDIIEVAMQDISSLLTDLGDKAQLRTLASTNWGSYLLTFNYTCTDKNYADLFSNVKFREAMSICVDRDQVSGLLSEGFLEPGQCAPQEGNFGYDAEWEAKWTDYSVDNAKKLLEECGLVMGSDGFYDFADGTDFTLTIYTYTDSGAADAYPVFEQYYKAAGINCATKDIEVSAFDTEVDNNNWYAILGPHTAIGGVSLKSRVQPFVPIAQSAEWYGEYGTYYGTNGEQGVKPEGDMAKLVEIYEKWKATPDSAERDQYTLDIYNLHKENLWTIAYLKAAGAYSLVSSKVHNYPDLLVSDDLYQYQNIIHYWTLFKTE